jgi:hypothetical protein
MHLTAERGVSQKERKVAPAGLRDWDAAVGAASWGDLGVVAIVCGSVVIAVTNGLHRVVFEEAG